MKQPPGSALKSFFLIVLSGILLSTPFFNGNLWLFAWVGFVPLFFVLHNRTKSQAFLLAYLTGIIFWTGTIYWLVHVTLLGQMILILYLALYFGIFGMVVRKKFYTFTAEDPRRPRAFLRRYGDEAAGGGLHLAKPEASRMRTIGGIGLPDALFVSSLWVILEYLRSHLFTGFGWALTGYSQYLNLPLIQVADITGVYGVSFLIVLVNLGFYTFLFCYAQPLLSGKKKNYASAAKNPVVLQRMGEAAGGGFHLLYLFLVLSVLAYGYYRIYWQASASYSPSGAKCSIPLRISLIQGNIAQELKWAPGAQPFILDRYILLTRRAAREGPDLIVWPEASSPGFLGEDGWVFEKIFALAKEIKIPLLIGSVVKESGKYFNSALLIDSSSKISNRYDKLHLVPFGEYVPLKEFLPFLETVVPIGDFSRGQEYTLFKLSAASSGIAHPSIQESLIVSRQKAKSARSSMSRGKTQGPSVQEELETGNAAGVGPQHLTFAVLICFEDTISELARNFTRRGADFLINITNDGWYKETSAPYQHLSASVFRAVENRVPLVRCANTGVSCFIDSNGRIIGKLSENGRDIFVTGFKTQTIILNKRASLYQKIGDLFVLGCIVQVIFYGIIGARNKFNRYAEIPGL